LSAEEGRVVIKDLDEAMRYVEALEEFFAKYDKAYKKFRLMVKRFYPAERKAISFGTNIFSGKGMERLVEEIVNRILEERLGKPREEHEEEIEREAEREAEEIIKKLKETSVKEQGQP